MPPLKGHSKPESLFVRHFAPHLEDSPRTTENQRHWSFPSFNALLSIRGSFSQYALVSDQTHPLLMHQNLFDTYFSESSDRSVLQINILVFVFFEYTSFLFLKPEPKRPVQTYLEKSIGKMINLGFTKHVLYQRTGTGLHS